MVFINKNVSDFYRVSPLATEKYVKAIVSESGGGSWGSIEGNIEDQDDLVTLVQNNSAPNLSSITLGELIFGVETEDRVVKPTILKEWLDSSAVRLDRVVQDIDADINTQNFKISESSKVIATSTKVHLTRATSNDELFIDDGNIRLTTMSGGTGLNANSDLITLGSFSLKLIVDPVNYNIKLDGNGAFSLTTHPTSLNWTGYNHSAICNIGGLQLTNDETTPITIKANGVDYITFDNGDMTIPVETVVSAIQAATSTQIDAIKLALGI